MRWKLRMNFWPRICVTLYSYPPYPAIEHLQQTAPQTSVAVQPTGRPPPLLPPSQSRQMHGHGQQQGQYGGYKKAAVSGAVHGAVPKGPRQPLRQPHAANRHRAPLPPRPTGKLIGFHISLYKNDVTWNGSKWHKAGHYLGWLKYDKMESCQPTIIQGKRRPLNYRPCKYRLRSTACTTAEQRNHPLFRMVVMWHRRVVVMWCRHKPIWRPKCHQRLTLSYRDRAKSTTKVNVRKSKQGT